MKDDASPREEVREIPDPGPAIGGDDSNAAKEQDAIIRDRYADDGKRQEHRRQQGVKNVAFYAVCGLVWFGLTAIVCIAGVWLYHLLTPAGWHWLAKEELDRVQSLLLSGGLSATVTLLGSKIFKS